MSLRGIQKCGIFAVLAVIFLTGTAVRGHVFHGKGFDIIHDAVSEQDVAAAAAEIQEAIIRLTDFFDKPLSRKVEIEISRRGLLSVVDDKKFRITYPASRIRRVNRFRDASFYHDLSILFEHAKEKEHKGLLTIGLATYLQDKFTPGKNVYPTDGAPLDEKTVEVMDQLDRFIPLEDSTAVRKGRRKMGASRRLAMLEQGSFIKYLIGRHGLEKFLRHYRGADFQGVYGMPRCRAEAAWFDFLVDRNPSLARLAELKPRCP